MDSLWHDLKYAVRGLWRTPGFTASAVFALALGIGSNTVIFSALHAVLLNPLAFRQLKDPERLVMVWEKNDRLMELFAKRMNVRLRKYRDWKERAQSFEDLAVWENTSLTLTAAEDRAGLKPEQVEAGIASSNFFPLLGISLRMGRNFTAEEMLPAKGQVAILSDELHRSRFIGDPQILGKTLTANGKPYRIIGVLPPGFQVPAIYEGFDQKKPKVWIPVNLHPDRDSGERMVHYVFGRLRAGVTLVQARAEMVGIDKRLTEENGEDAGFAVSVFSVAEENAGPQLRRALLLLQAAVVFVLLIACANTGNLLLTRAAVRQREIAVRSALGASRLRILRQMFTETSVLSLLGAAGGLLLAFWALRVLTAFAPDDVPALKVVQIDGTVLAFTTGIALASSFLFGIAPAWHALKENLNAILARTARNMAASSRRLRNTLATAEIALSIVLLIGAGLMIRSLGALMSTDLGFRPYHLLLLRVTLPEVKYPTPERIASFNNRLLEGVRRTPGIQAAALTSALPMRAVTQSSFEIPGRTYPPGTAPVANWSRSSDGYFETLGIRLVRGRTFTRQETTVKQPNVAVVNEAFAREHFPNEDPLGKSITFGNETGGETHFAIVGIVANERQLGPDGEQFPQFYLPGSRLREMILVVRTTGDPLSMAPAVKQQVWNIDKDQAVSGVTTADAALREWTALRRFNLILLVSFAGIALVMATVGLYSVLAYSVTLRTREIGIRMALGAEPRRVTRFFLKQGLAMAMIGITAGLGGAFALTRFMQSLLFGVGTGDPLTFWGVAALLTVVTLLASYIPAARAAMVDPMEALRVE